MADPTPTGMTESDRDELRWRRISEKIIGDIDSTVKRRYWWMAVIVVVVTWLGGAGLLTALVKEGVDKKIDSLENSVKQRADSAITDLQKETDKAQFTVEEARTMAEASRKTAEGASKTLAELQDTLKKVGDAISGFNKTEDEISKQTNENKASLDASQIKFAALSDQAALAKQQLLDFVAAIDKSNLKANTAVAQAIQIIRSNSIIYIQWTGSIAAQDLDNMRSVLAETFKATVPSPENRQFSGDSNVRYFYKEDLDFANSVTKKVKDELARFGLGNTNVVTSDFTGYQGRKSAKGTLEVWLNPLEHVNPPNSDTKRDQWIAKYFLPSAENPCIERGCYAVVVSQWLTKKDAESERTTLEASHSEIGFRVWPSGGKWAVVIAMGIKRSEARELQKTYQHMLHVDFHDNGNFSVKE